MHFGPISIFPEIILQCFLSVYEVPTETVLHLFKALATVELWIPDKIYLHLAEVIDDCGCRQTIAVLLGLTSWLLLVDCGPSGFSLSGRHTCRSPLNSPSEGLQHEADIRGTSTLSGRGRLTAI